MAASTSYVVALLRIMSAHAGSVFDAQEVHRRLVQLRPSRFGSIPVHSVDNVLDELAQLGIVRRADDDGWFVEVREGNGRGDGSLPPAAGSGDGEGGEGGGGGLAEVIAHPILFSRSEAEFESALDAALGG